MPINARKSQWSMVTRYHEYARHAIRSGQRQNQRSIGLSYGWQLHGRLTPDTRADSVSPAPLLSDRMICWVEQGSGRAAGHDCDDGLPPQVTFQTLINAVTISDARALVIASFSPVLVDESFF